MNAQLFEAQRREAEAAKTLLELSREISSTTELSEVLDGIADGASRILGSRRVSVWLPTDDGRYECGAVRVAEGVEPQVTVGMIVDGGGVAARRERQSRS